MKLLIKDMDIATGGPLIVILNEKDALMLGLYPTDRVRITKGNRSTIAIVDFAESDKAVPSGQIGLFEEVLDKLHAVHKNKIDLKLEEKPLSVRHIKRKLDGKELNYNEIYEIIKDLVDGKLINTELTYYVAANYIRGMSMKEVAYLTKAMIDTGKVLKLKNKMIVDKHCIGGIPGNRTTMGVVPIVAAAGLIFPKTSSRAITSPAGTADTMEVLCNVSFEIPKLKKIINKIGCCIVWGGAVNLAPADDTIINVEHPLSIDAEGQLLASIMAKKGSVSATHVAIDIPVGRGAKVKSRKKALKLKKQFEKLGRELKIKTHVMITDGKEPIGNGVGAALEARDVLWMLEGHPNAPKDLLNKCLKVSADIFELTGKAKRGKGIELAKQMINSGKAYKKMWDTIIAQGAKIKKVSDIKLGEYTYHVYASKSGKIRHVENRSIARIARMAGCPKDKGAGVYLYKHVGDSIKKGEKLLTIYASKKVKLGYAKNLSSKIDGIIVK